MKILPSSAERSVCLRLWAAEGDVIVHECEWREGGRDRRGDRWRIYGHNFIPTFIFRRWTLAFVMCNARIGLPRMRYDWMRPQVAPRIYYIIIVHWIRWFCFEMRTMSTTMVVCDWSERAITVVGGFVSTCSFRRHTMIHVLAAATPLPSLALGLFAK